MCDINVYLFFFSVKICGKKTTDNVGSVKENDRSDILGSLVSFEVTETERLHAGYRNNPPVRLPPACAPACLPVCLPAFLPVFLHTCLPTCLPVCLSACLSACLFAYLLACLSACLAVSWRTQLVYNILVIAIRFQILLNKRGSGGGWGGMGRWFVATVIWDLFID